MGERAAVEGEVRAWLAEMERCVRAEDYAGGRAIFAPDVVAFGTRGARLAGLEATERDQWRRVWGAIRGFTFLVDQLAWGTSGDVAWLACPWTSEGFGPDGVPFARPGRMTVVLERRAGRWLAVHSHFSLNPT
jgi:ketosteroid isomerase-like protein